MKKSMKKTLRNIGAKVIALTVLSCLAFNTAGASLAGAFTLNESVIYDSQYTSVAEANEEAKKVFSESVEEGTILLKNDGTLPLSKGMYMSVFGNFSKMSDGIAAGGFNVYNMTKTNPDEFTAAEVQKLGVYDEAAVVLIQTQSAGEGSGIGYYTDEVEDNKDADGKTYTYADGETAFVHDSQAFKKSDEDVKYKHPLQLSDENEKLIKFVTENYSKVIVMICGSSIMEAGVLENNDNINALLWTGSINSGTGTLEALGALLNGESSPSGRTNMLWAWDFTSDPTWYNDGNSKGLGNEINENGSAANSFDNAAGEDAYEYGGVNTTKAFRTEDGQYYTRAEHTSQDTTKYIWAIEYEEDIYSGYRYHETAAAEAALANYTGYNYENEVVYPFGYGMSYTSFKQEIVGSDLSDWGKEQNEYTKGGTMTVSVKVTNTGNVSGKDVVQIYGHSPYYKGGVEKTENVLLAFEKTATLRPGQSETLKLTVNIQDMASFDWNDENGNGVKNYELDKVAATDTAGNAMHDVAGHYELRLQNNSHDVIDTIELDDLTKDIILDKDDFTGNQIESLFTGDDIFNTLSYDFGTDQTLVEEGKMTLLSRSDFKTSWPAIATIEDMTRSEAYYASVDAFAEYEADDTAWLAEYFDVGETLPEDEAGYPWSISAAEFNANYSDWSQAENAAEQEEMKKAGGWLNYADMATVDKHNTTIVYQNTDPKAPGYTTTAGLVGLTGAEAWTKLMNQLTWEELRTLANDGTFGTAAVASINREHSRYMDGPAAADQEMSETFRWGDTPHFATTWNKDIQYRRGVIIGYIGMLDPIGEGLDGWYAPAVNLLRSPFTGRTAEYYAEDPCLAGHIAGSMVAGGISVGMIMTMKHVALNAAEVQRQSLHTYLTEQVARERYFKVIQIVIQEYGCRSIMGSYNAIGEVFSSANYAFTNALIRQEWGFEGNACTDAVGPNTNFFSMDSLVRGGTDLTINPVVDSSYISAGNEDCIISGTYDAENNRIVLTDGTVCYTQWYWVRMAALDILYSEVNMHSSHNGGVDVTGFAGQTVSLTQGESVGSSGNGGDSSDSGNQGGGQAPGGDQGGQAPGGDQGGQAPGGDQGGQAPGGDQGGEMPDFGSRGIDTPAAPAVNTDGNLAMEFATVSADNLKYAVIDGELPEGLELGSDGQLNGTPLEVGTFTVNVEVRAYNWIRKTAMFTIVVESAFTTDVDIADLTYGEAVDAYIESDVFSASDYTDEGDSFVISVAKGSALPKGLRLEKDASGNYRILGNIMEEGNVTTRFVLNIRDENTSVNFAGVKGETTVDYTTAEFELTFNAKAAEEVVEEDTMQLRVSEDGYIQYSTDGGETWINVIEVSELKGDKGDKGDAGAPGEKGDKGDAGEGALAALGCGSVTLASTAVLTAAAACAVVLLRKRENN